MSRASQVDAGRKGAKPGTKSTHGTITPPPACKGTEYMTADQPDVPADRSK